MNADRSQLISTTYRLVGEFIVIFLGVYLAFLAEEWRQEKEDDKLRVLLLTALREEFARNQRSLDASVTNLVPGLDHFISNYRAGRMPPLDSVEFGFAYSISTWESILGAGGNILLDINLVFSINDFYDSVKLFYEDSLEAKQKNLVLILPRAEAPAEEFYDPKTLGLKKNYYWYLVWSDRFRTGLVTLQDSNRVLLTAIDKALARAAR